MPLAYSNVTAHARNWRSRTDRGFFLRGVGQGATNEGGESPPLQALIRPRDAELVVDLPDTGDGFDQVFGVPLRAAAVHGAGEGDFAVLHLHFDVGCIDV